MTSYSIVRFRRLPLLLSQFPLRHNEDITIQNKSRRCIQPHSLIYNRLQIRPGLHLMEPHRPTQPPVHLALAQLLHEPVVHGAMREHEVDDRAERNGLLSDPANTLDVIMKAMLVLGSCGLVFCVERR